MGLQHVLRLMRCAAKIILTDFNLAVSTPTAKPPNFSAIWYIPHRTLQWNPSMADTLGTNILSIVRCP